jgi:hypothetical protein
MIACKKWLDRLKYTFFLFTVTIIPLEIASRFILVPLISRSYQTQNVLNTISEDNTDNFDLIAIGDSFVEQGKFNGWQTMLEHKGWKILNLGQSSTCPSQYFEVYNRLSNKLVNSKQKVLIVLYIGNDFADEAIWQSLKDKTQYFLERNEVYFSKSSEVFWPYAKPRLSLGALSERIGRHSELIRVLTYIKTNILIYYLEKTQSDNDLLLPEYKVRLLAQDQILAEFLNSNLNEEHVVKTKDNVFFVQHHNATSFEFNDVNKNAAQNILNMIRSIREHRNVYILPILSREEIGVSFHKRSIYKNEKFIEELKEVNSNVIDINPQFVDLFKKMNLYLPDGHWNTAGNYLFSQLVEMLILQ